MWQVNASALDGKPANIYILGVSHSGLPAEYDDYYVKTVLPAFDTANVLVSERAAIDQNAPACPIALPAGDASTDLLRRAREHARLKRLKLLNSFDMNKLRDSLRKAGMSEQVISDLQEANRRTAAQYADSLSESTLAFALMEIEPEADAGAHRGPIDGALAMRRPGIAFESIDTSADLVDAYCGAGTDRQLFLQGQLALFELREDAAALKVREQRANANFLASLERQVMVGLGVLPSRAFEESFICERNRKWVQRIKNKLGPEVRFYSLGLAHLLPSPFPNLSCTSLLESLRAEGMSVTLVP